MSHLYDRIMLKIDEKNYKSIEKELHLFYVQEINRFCLDSGGHEKLSKILGKTRNYIRNIIDRSKINRTEKLYLEIKKHFGGPK